MCVCVHCSVVTHQYLYCHNFLVKQPPGVWQGQKAPKSTPQSCLAWNNRVLWAVWHTTSRVIHTLLCRIQRGKKMMNVNWLERDGGYWVFFQMKYVNLTSAMPCLPLEQIRVGFSVISQPLFFLALRLLIWVSLLFFKSVLWKHLEGMPRLLVVFALSPEHWSCLDSW